MVAMGDPLSTASGIIAVIQISATVLSACYRYAVLLNDAHKTFNVSLMRSEA